MLEFVFSVLAAMSTTGPSQVCNSTIFGYPGDGYGGRTPTVLTKKPVTDDDVGIAHRTWKMGSKILVKNLRTGKYATGVVLDRGPYGAKDIDGKWFNKCPRCKDFKRPGRYRGCADLTPSLAKKLGHDGFDPIRLWRVR